MALKFEITGDNRNFLDSLDGARNGVRRVAQDIEQSGMSIEDMFKRIGAAAGIAFSLDQAKNFVRSVMDMRGQFQQLEIAFNTMLQSEEKATALMSQLVDTAAKTPFDLQGVAQGAKQLLAYGIAADEVNETITRLGDIAAGLSIPLGDLVYLYGTTITQGRMFTMDLRQFMGRGIPMAEELAKQFGVAKNEVAGLVTAGQVSSDAVKKAIWDMTSEGSRFGGLMAEQSKSITGQISNIEDAFDTMLNDIGKSNEGLINSGLEGVSFLIEHYEEVGRVLLGLVAAYGEYKAALMVTSAIQKSMAKQANEIEMARQAELQQVYDQFSTDKEVAAEDASTAAIVQNTASREGNVTAIDSQIAALERKMLAEIEEKNNAYQSAREALNVLKEQEAQKDSEINTLKEQIDTSKEYIESEKEAMQSALSLGNAEEAEAIKTNIATESKRLETLQDELGTAQKEKNIIADQKHSAVITTKTTLTQKQTLQEKLSNMQKAVSVVQTKAQTTATGLWVAVTKSATAAMNSLKAAMMSNPFGLALAAVTTLITLLPMFSSETSKASEEIERFGESAVKQTRNLETLMAVVDSTSSESKVHKDAVDELAKIYEEYGFKIDDEIDKLQQLRNLHDLVTDAIHREGEERQKANLLQSYNEALEEATTNMRDALQNAFESAEWDASGTFDDFDAEEYQEKAKELTHIIGAIIQSESDALATLTGDELEAKISEVNDRIKKAYEDMGLELSKSFVKSGGTTGAQGYTIDAPVDVDAIQIMRDYAEATHSVTEGRKKLIESFERGKKSAEEEKNEIDYTKLSIADLAKTASEASDNVSDLGDKSASPTVDKTSIDAANDAATTAKTSIDILNGTTAKPLIDTSSIGFAIGQTNTLLGNMFQLQNFGMGGGKSSFSLGFNPNQFGFGKTGQFNLFGGKKPVWGTIGGKSGVQWMPNIPITDPALLAQNELNSRVNGANTQKKVDDLLKEVNEAFNKATFDSDEYNFLKGLKERLEAKSRKKSGGKGGKKGNTADKIERETQKLEDMQDDVDLSRLRSVQDMQTRLTNLRLALMEDGAEKVRMLQEQQNKEEIDNIERQKEDAIRKYIEEEKKLHEQQEAIKKARNPKYKEQKFDESKVDTSAIANQYDELINMTRQSQAQAAFQEDLRAMNEYLKEFGTLEQKRLAIIEEYDEKINRETSENKKKLLEAERNSLLARMEAQSISQDIDWNQTFSGIGNVLQEIAKETLKKVDDYMSTDEYKKLNAADKKAYQDLRSELVDAGGVESRSPFKTSTWEEISRLTEKYKEDVREFISAQENHKLAVDKLIKAQDELKKATTADAKAIAKRAVEEAQKEVDATATTKNDAKDKKDQSQRNLHEAAEGAAQGLQNFSTILGQITSGTLSGFAVGVANLVNQIAGKADKAAASIGELGGKAGGLIGAILQIIDALGEEPTKFIDSLLDKIAKVIEAVLSELPQIIVSVVNGVGNIVGGVIKGIANMFSGGAAFGSNKEEMEKRISELKTANESLSKSIDSLAEVISRSDSTNRESLDAYKRQLQAEKEWEANQREAIDARASEWSNSGHGFLGLGGKHSFNYYMPENNWYGWSRFSEVLKQNGYNTNVNRDNIWHLTPEEMKVMREFAPSEWAALMNGDGESNPGDLIDEYIERAGQIEELTDKLNEKLTGYSWEGFFDSYKSLLKNLTSTTEDFGDKIEEIISSALLESLANEEFRERIKALYKYIADHAGDGLDESELNFIRSENEKIANDMIARRQNLIDAGLLKPGETEKYEQKASQGGWESMDEDTGQELNGRFTSLQIAGEKISEGVSTMLGTLSALSALTEGSNMTLTEIRNLMIMNNAFLEDILAANKEYYKKFHAQLDKIVTQTK